MGLDGPPILRSNLTNLSDVVGEQPTEHLMAKSREPILLASSPLDRAACSFIAVEIPVPAVAAPAIEPVDLIRLVRRTLCLLLVRLRAGRGWRRDA